MSLLPELGCVCEKHLKAMSYATYPHFCSGYHSIIYTLLASTFTTMPRSLPRWNGFLLYYGSKEGGILFQQQVLQSFTHYHNHITSTCMTVLNCHTTMWPNTMVFLSLYTTQLYSTWPALLLHHYQATWLHDHTPTSFIANIIYCPKSWNYHMCTQEHQNKQVPWPCNEYHELQYSWISCKFPWTIQTQSSSTPAVSQICIVNTG